MRRRNENSGRIELYRTIFSHIFDPVVIYRVIGEAGESTRPRVLFYDVNPAYEANNGVSRKDIIGRSYDEVWKDSEEGWRSLVSSVARSGQAASYEGYSRITKRYLHAFAFMPFEGEVVVIFSDLTENKKTEKELSDHRNKLRELTARLSIAEEKTRRDIAVMLHDRIGHALISALQKLRSLRGERQNLPDAVRIDEVVRDLEDLLDRTRSFTFDISSPLLYEVGLEAAVERLLEKTFSDKVRWDLNTSPSLSLDINMSILLYRIAQELVLNIVKHAEATKVYVRFKKTETGVRMTIDDNGKGFSDPSSAVRGSLGLMSIREMLHSIGGHMHIISSPGKGTVVTVDAPCRISANGEDLS